MSKEQVDVFVDVLSLWRGAKKAMGETSRVSFIQLRRLIYIKRCDQRRVVHSTAYVTSVVSPVSNYINIVRNKTSSVIKMLESNGFTVKDLSVPTTDANKDVWNPIIASEIISTLDACSTICLVTCSGDYTEPIKIARERGKFVELFTFKETLDQVDTGPIDRVVYLTEHNSLFTGSPVWQTH